VIFIDNMFKLVHGVFNQKNIFFLCIVIFLTALLSCAGKNIKNKETSIHNNNESGRVIGEYIIKVKEGITEDFLKSYFSSLYISAVKQIHGNIFLIKIENDPGPAKMKEEYVNNKQIIDIQPNYKYELIPSKKRKIEVQTDE